MVQSWLSAPNDRVLKSAEQQLDPQHRAGCAEWQGERRLEAEWMCPRSGTTARRFVSVWKHAASLEVGDVNFFCQEARKHHSKEF